MTVADGEPAGDRLRGYRRAAGLTQRQLADAARVSIGVVRDLEQGLTSRPRVESVRRLASALELDAQQSNAFLGGTGKIPTAATVSVRRRGLWIGVLGPLMVCRYGRQVHLGRGRLRAVVGLLALHADTGLHRAAIVDALWPDSPPASAVAMVQSYVSRIRRLLDLRNGWLDTTGSTYRLRLGADELDLGSFRMLVHRARDAHTAGAFDAASEWYDEALGLWRGDVVADVDVLRAHPVVACLDPERGAVIEDFAAATGAAGRHDLALPHLRELTAREPLNERAQARLITALAGSGHQAAALRVFTDVRRRLDEELGVLPCAELADAHQRVLRPAVGLAAT